MGGHGRPDLNVIAPFPPTRKGDAQTDPTPPWQRPGQRRAPAAGRRARERCGKHASTLTTADKYETEHHSEGQRHSPRRAPRTVRAGPGPAAAPTPAAPGPGPPRTPRPRCPSRRPPPGDQHLTRRSRATSLPRRGRPASEPPLAPPANRGPGASRGWRGGTTRDSASQPIAARLLRGPSQWRRGSPSPLLPILRLPSIPRIFSLWSTPLAVGTNRRCREVGFPLAGGGTSAARTH